MNLRGKILYGNVRNTDGKTHPIFGKVEEKHGQNMLISVMMKNEDGKHVRTGKIRLIKFDDLCDSYFFDDKEKDKKDFDNSIQS